MYVQDLKVGDWVCDLGLVTDIRVAGTAYLVSFNYSPFSHWLSLNEMISLLRKEIV